MTTQDFLADLEERRGQKRTGGNPTRFVELVDGEEVSNSFYEPDAETFRSPYYYNTRQNKLYKRVVMTNPVNQRTSHYWQLVSSC